MVIPNEHVVTSTLFNRSTGDHSAPAAAAVWLPPGADVQAARQALRPLDASGIEVRELTPEGVKLVVHGPRSVGGTGVGGEEAALRERAHQLLAEAGILARDEESEA
jgi:hypothetical protein